MTAWMDDPRLLAGLANHLWQSTLCLGVALLVVRLLRRHDARWRHLVWLTGSLKFLLPFSLLVSAGAGLPHPDISAAPSPALAAAVQFVGEPFTPPPDEPLVVRTSLDVTVIGHAPAAARLRPAAAAVFLWISGAAALGALRAARWRGLRRSCRGAPPVDGDRERRALLAARSRLQVDTPLALIAASHTAQPGVVGVAKPAILWPAALSGLLSDAELDAIMAHEVAHVRRADNLAAAIHRLVELIFWFYPVVWWIEARLVHERERACDEAVVACGHEPRAYARAILKVSNFCLKAAPLAAAGLTGASLTQRVEDIMTAQIRISLGATRRALLAVAAAVIVAGPIGVGYLQAAPGLPALPALSSSFETLLAPAPLEPIASAGLAPLDAPGTITPPAPQAAASRVSGTVTDQRGAAIADAAVMAVPAGGAPSSTTKTDGNGAFILDLMPAQYELRVAKPGFRAFQTPLFVNRESPVTRNIQLQLGGVTESINVRQAPNDPRSLPELLEQAKAAYEQGKYVDAESLTRLALARLTAESAARRQQARLAAGPGTGAAGAPVRVGGDIKEPMKIHDVKPIYPPQALEAKVGGIVIIEAAIGQDGSVVDAKVLRGQPLLNQAALDAVLQWQFTPTLLNGAPVEVLMTVTVNFTLQ